KGPDVGPARHQAGVAHPVRQRLRAGEVRVHVEGEPGLRMVEAQRVRIPADQRAVPDGRGPELTREEVERVAFVAVADVADEPRIVLRLVPVAAAEEAEVRLRLARSEERRGGNE